MKTKITVEATIAAPIEKIWQHWTNPEHIINWNFASDDWCAPAAVNDLSVGGKFSFRMEARDGSMGFDLDGIYTVVKTNEIIEYNLEDGRNVKVLFVKNGDKVDVIETFEAEDTNPIELQKTGWQSILNSYKNYVEKN